MILKLAYINDIIPFINKPQVKIVTGIRRSGKPVVLRLLKEELLRRNVKEGQIVGVPVHKSFSHRHTDRREVSHKCRRRFLTSFETTTKKTLL